MSRGPFTKTFKRYDLNSHDANESPETPFLNQQAASSSSAASEPSYANKPCFVATDATPKRKMFLRQLVKS